MKKYFFLTILAVVSVCCVCGCKVDEHGHSYSAETVAPDCTHQGYVHYECECGDSYDGDYIKALGHDLIAHGGKEATCEEGGWEAYETCSRCDYTTYTEISALGHNIVSHAGQAPTCTEVGWAEYEVCTLCNYSTYKEIPALGHDIVNHAGQAPTCTAMGWEAYDACTRCNYTTLCEIPALEHDLTHYDEKLPTCTEVGWSAYDVCSRGDYNTFTALDALGHDIEHMAAKAPTCTEVGCEEYDYCTRGDYTQYAEISALGHEITVHEAKQPDCTHSGWDAYETCSRCDLNGYVNLPALGHNFPDYTVDDLGHTRNCSRCNLLDAGDHEWKKNTCTVCKFSVNYSAGLIYEETAGAYSVAGRGKATDSHIKIPEVYNNLPVTAISPRAFYENNGIVGVTIPGSITTFGELCFAGCESLQRIDYNAVAAVLTSDNTAFKESGNADIGITVHIGNTVPSIPAYLFNGVANIKNIVFNDGVICSGIGEYSFAGCSVNTLTLPASIVTFGEGAFKENNALNGVYYGGNLENWFNLTFADGDSNPLKYAHNLYIGGELVTEIVTPDSIEKINNYAFTGGSIQSLTLGENIKSIGASAFDSCRNMVEINYNAVACANLRLSYYAFQLAGADGEGVTVNIGEKVTVIPAYLFCCSPDSALSSKITRVIFAENGVCETIGYRAFMYCGYLVEANLGNVKTIGGNAFTGCTSLITVHAGQSLKLIDQQAFMDCANLTNFNYGGTMDDWSEVQKEASLFFRVTGCTVNCSDGSVPAEDVV